MNLAARAVMITLVTLTFWLSGVGVATAHTSLVSSDPPSGARLTSPTPTVVLNFSEEINPAFADVAVTSADGRNWVSGSAIVEGPRLTVAIGPDRLTNGPYTVGYRVVSADGHPVSGSYTFTVAGVPEQTSPTAAASSAAPSTAETSPAAPAGDSKASVLTAAGIGLALGGVIAFWQSRRHRRKNTAHPGDEPGPSRGGQDVSPPVDPGH